MRHCYIGDRAVGYLQIAGVGVQEKDRQIVQSPPFHCDSRRVGTCVSHPSARGVGVIGFVEPVGRMFETWCDRGCDRGRHREKNELSVVIL